MKRYKQLFEIVGDKETFSFFGLTYDIAKAWKLIQKKKHEISTLSIKDLSKFFNIIKINKEYAMSLSNEEAKQEGIFVDDKKYDSTMLIDGWHRAYNLYSRKIPKMRVYILSDPKEIEAIRL